MDILIVDDKEEICRVIEMVLKRDGHFTFGARNGATAKDMIRSIVLDLVICDIVMPDVDGLNLLRFSKEFRPNLPFVLMSADPPMSEFEARALGAAALLQKPLDFRGLDELVKRLCRLV